MRVSISIRIISVITVHVQYGNIQADRQEEEKKTGKEKHHISTWNSND